ncbi:MAG TPA: TVP38/TMEM64 family protein [Verrucomicrobiae bacterium]|jgi:uncharacterized membrane protein YdjX (TVP38/TMEM64 family)
MNQITNRANVAQTQPASSKWKWIIWLLGIAAVVLALKYLGVFPFLQAQLKAALDGIRGLGVWGPVLFIGLYIVACVFFIPGSVLTLGAGAIFGIVYGSLYVSIGATLGATAAFLVGRYLARGWVAKKIEGNTTFSAIDKAVADEGWKIVGLTRLSPVFPFSLLNYVFGVTRVKLRDYVLASWIGMMPGTVMYVYIGSLADAGDGTKTPAQTVLKWVGLAATIVVTIYVTKIARQALARKISTPAQP